MTQNNQNAHATLRVLQRAAYRCEVRTPQQFQCNAPAGHVDAATGQAVCREHDAAAVAGRISAAIDDARELRSRLG